jgi:ATP-binding cassette subfamily C protein
LQVHSIMARPVRTPQLLQLEASECGAAALGILLGHFGRFVPLPELRRRCGVSRGGSTASRLVQAARHYGLEAKGYTRDLAGLRTLQPPYVVFWRFNHFVVVEGLTDRAAHLNDPAGGRRTVPIEEFDAGFTGVVLTFQPGPAFRKGGRPPRLLPAVAARLRGRGAALALCTLMGLLLALPTLTVAALGGLFLDALLRGRTEHFEVLLGALAGALAVQAALSLATSAAQRRLMLALEGRLTDEFLGHLLRLPLSFYAQRFAGEIASRVPLHHQVADTLGKLPAAIVGLLTLTSYAAVLLWCSPPLAALALTFVAASGVSLWALTRKCVPQSLLASQDAGKAAAVAVAALRAVETVKAAGLESGLFARWAGYYTRFAVGRQELERSAVAVSVLPTLFEALAVAVVLVVGGLWVSGGAMSLGLLVAFATLTRVCLGQAAELVRLGPCFHDLRASLLRLDDVRTSAEAEPRDEAISAPERLRGELEVRGICFAHGPFDPPSLQGVNLRAAPGQRVAVVGGSGSGKSTLARLLAGLYTPTAGDVLLDGRPLVLVPADVRQRSVALVDQDVLLFAGSVRDNLTLWDAGVSDDVLWRACRDALADDVVAALPGGLDAELTEGGANLSGGQRQRLEIARALVGDPALLILDEATSALDVETEAALMANLRRRGCTLILVAHRLSTVRDCDEIVVLRGGAVVERGTHAALGAAGGAYARLVRTEQAEEAREEP